MVFVVLGLAETPSPTEKPCVVVVVVDVVIAIVPMTMYESIQRNDPCLLATVVGTGVVLSLVIIVVFVVFIVVGVAMLTTVVSLSDRLSVATNNGTTTTVRRTDVGRRSRASHSITAAIKTETPNQYGRWSI